MPRSLRHRSKDTAEKRFFYFWVQVILLSMNTSSQITRTAHWIAPHRFGELLLVVQTPDKAHKEIIELITQWVLRASFYLIAAGDWLPDHDDLRYSVFRYTHAVNETLDNMSLVRARTCFQLLDLLKAANGQNKPVLILDFLHHFYNADIELYTRDEILEQCCQHTKQLAMSNPVAVLVPNLKTEDYRRFFPVLAAVSDQISEAEEPVENKNILSQGLLF
jgi:hypothetical protein